MTGGRRDWTRRWQRLSWAVALLVMLVALSAMIELPEKSAAPLQAAPPDDVTAQGGAIDNAVDDDHDNRLWVCTTQRAPFGDENIDKPRCFTFRYQVPPEGVSNAALHVAIKPLGSLQDTDSLAAAIGEPYADCAWAQGEMPGCVTLHSGFKGDETSLNLDLLNMACDSSVQGSPEAQQALLSQLQTGVLHFMLQDDTAVFGAQLVLNGGPATFPCGTSVQPWTPPPPSADQSARRVADGLSRLLTGSADAHPPRPGAVAGAAAAATTVLAGYAYINAVLNRAATGSALSAGSANQSGATGAPTGGLEASLAEGPPDTAVRGSAADRAHSPRGEYPLTKAAPGSDAQAIGESDLRDALDQLKDKVEGLADAKSEPSPRLLVTRGRANKTAVVLSAGPVTIGRQSSAILTLYDEAVSRHHATVAPESGAWVLTDMKSANGTYVNGTRVSRWLLRPGDQIQMGQVVLVFEGAASAGWRCNRCGRAGAPNERLCASCGLPRPHGGN